MESKLFESIMRLKEDNPTSYTYAIHNNITKVGNIKNFNWKNFNNARLEKAKQVGDNKLVFGIEGHKGRTTEPILENFVDEVVYFWNKNYPKQKLGPEEEKILRQAAADYYILKTGHR